MNEFLRQYIMKAIRGMIDSNRVPEWQVRQFALEWYSKGVLTEEDLQEIDDRYKPEPVEETVGENPEETEENINMF